MVSLLLSGEYLSVSRIGVEKINSDQNDNGKRKVCTWTQKSQR